MKKVLFITYYWPPSGKASSHWPLKIIKHLPSFGLQPLVLTVDEDTFSQKDKTFLNEIPTNVKVFRAKSIEPFNVYKKLVGKSKDEQLSAPETISIINKNFGHRFSVWIRMNLFIPDARIGWYFPAVKTALSSLKKEEVSAIVSIGPPHTTHLIGKKISSDLSLPHIPVFIDPWVDISYYRNFKRSKLTLSIDNHLEKSVLKNATSVVFVTETMKQYYLNKYSFLKEKSNVLYWGYSEEDFSIADGRWKTEDVRLKNIKVIVHAGNIFSYQNPVNFWKQIKKENDSGNELKLKFIGTVDPVIKEAVAKAGISDRTEYLGFLPYKKMLEEICRADYLLVCATEPRHVPGKFFEYLRAGKPIIAFGDGNEEVKKILSDSNAGLLFGYDASAETFFKTQKTFSTNQEFVRKFERRKIAEAFADIILNKLNC